MGDVSSIALCVHSFEAAFMHATHHVNPNTSSTWLFCLLVPLTFVKSCPEPSVSSNFKWFLLNIGEVLHFGIGWELEASMLVSERNNSLVIEGSILHCPDHVIPLNIVDFIFVHFSGGDLFLLPIYRNGHH
jgi:hypothetical protein